MPLLTVTHGYICSRAVSLPFGQYQITLVTEAHVCERLAQGSCPRARRPGVEPASPAP